MGYRKSLLERETVNGKPTEFVFHIKNIGDKSAPRGHVKIVFKTPYGMGEFTRTFSPIEIAALERNEEFFLKRSVDLDIPGLWFITLKIELAKKPEKKEKIEYYQSEGGTPNLERWLCPLHVVNRHQLDLISRLEKFLKKKGQ